MSATSEAYDRIDDRIDSDNPNQVTRSKTRLRQEIRELQDALAQIKGEPIRRKLAALEAEVRQVRERCERIEDASAKLVTDALVLAKLIAGESDKP